VGVGREALPALFDLLEKETEPSARRRARHWLFATSIPIRMGRTNGRFLMNAMLASGGYPWAVIRVRIRNTYLKALDSASIDMDINPFSASWQSVCDGRLSNRSIFPEPKLRHMIPTVVSSVLGTGREKTACVRHQRRSPGRSLSGGTRQAGRIPGPRQAIELKARRKYLDGETEPDGSVLIRTTDLMECCNTPRQ